MLRSRSCRGSRRSPGDLAALWLFAIAGWLPAQGVINPSLLAAPAADAAAAPQPGSPMALVQQHHRAVARVFVEVRRGRTPFPIERPGSAVVVDPSGWLVTWSSLVDEAASIADNHVVVQLGDAAATRLDAVIQARDAATGLCLLRVAAPPFALPFVELADAAAARPADPVLVLARPEDQQLVAFAGVLGRALAGTTLGGQPVAKEDLLLTDARIDLRCHGAALLDRDGRLLGLCSAEHVRRDVQEPTLADLQAPSFGVVVTVERLRAAFRSVFTAEPPANRTLVMAPAAGAPAPGAVAVARAAAGIVAVHAGSGPVPDLGDRDPYATQRRAGIGSGVVLTRSGLVVTNRHLVADSRTCTVRLLDGRAFVARVLGEHRSSNLALLQAGLPAGTVLEPVDGGGDGEGLLAERVYAVGNPLGHTSTVTAGVLSAVRANGRLQTDSKIGNANAGGALLDGSGRLLGIVDGGEVDPIEVAFRRQGDAAKTETGLGTCIDLPTVRQAFATQLAEHASGEPFVQTSPASQQQLAARRDAVAAMVAATAPALLNVYVSRAVRRVDDDSNPFAEHQPIQLRGESLGSGVVITRGGLALTNWHVVDAAVEADGSARPDHAVLVRTFDGRSLPAEVLAISREDDLALLQLGLPEGTEATAIELGDSDALPIGATVLACGNPLGFANTITAGIVTAKDQGIRVKGRWAKLENLIETDAAINGGNSGGALLDAQGRLVGINSAGSRGFSSRGYAIPVNHARRQVLSLLLSAYKLRSPDLGLRVQDQDGAVVVAEVDPLGPAARAGVVAGERITALGGSAVTWSPGFALLLRAATPGAALRLSLQQGGNARDVDVVPLSPAVAAVQRQCGIELSVLSFQQAPDRVQAAAVALHRQFTGNPTAEPGTIQEQVLRIERVHPGCRSEPPLQPGDLLLAIELEGAAGSAELRRCTDVVVVQKLFNDRALGSYEGTQFVCWVQQQDGVRRVRLLAKRLLP